MRISQLLWTLALAWTTSGCALLHGHLPSTPSGVLSEVSVVADAERARDAKCVPISQTEVGWQEELALGGAVGVHLVAKHGGVLLDGMQEKTPEPLAKQVAAGTPIVLPASPKNELVAQVAIIGRNLAAFSSRPGLPWTFAVIVNDAPNALSAPGGYVFVTTGLLKRIQNEAQLAGVLAHEIAHVTHRHSLNKYRESRTAQCNISVYYDYLIRRNVASLLNNVTSEIRGLARIAYAFDAPNINLDAADKDVIEKLVDKLVEALASGNDKEAEFQADRTALELVSFAGYDPAEYERFLASLGNQGGWLSTHPSTDARVEKLKALREGDLKAFSTGRAKPDLSSVLAPVR